MTKKINIGLDLGIASVGWAIVDSEQFKIIDAGSRLFPEAGGSNSATSRRIKRSIRRQNRRKKLRVEDFKKICNKYNLLNNPYEFWNESLLENNIIDLKIKALNEKIALDEFLKLLLNYIKNRGSFNFKEDIIQDSIDKNSNITNEEIEEATRLVNSKLPCFIQKEYFEKESIFRNSSNRMDHKKLEEEINKIIEKQCELKSFNLKQEFVDEFFEIFNRKRKFYEGPNKPSPFSWVGDDKEETERIFYENLIGRDTYDKSQPRAPKNGLYPLLFNLLNDLNNIKIISSNLRENEKITETEKRSIVEKLFSGQIKSLNLVSLAKEIGVKNNDFEGYRIDKSGKALFTQFVSLKKIRDVITANTKNDSWIEYRNFDLIDEIINCLTVSQSSESACNKIIKIFKNFQIKLSENEIFDVSETLSILYCNPIFAGSHSLGNETIKSLIFDMWSSNNNSQQIIAERGMKPQYKYEFRDSKYIPIVIEQINEMLISPAVKRTLIQGLKVLREIQRQYRDYEINDICIELARENNGDEQTKNEKRQQKLNEETNKMIEQEFGKDKTKLSKKMVKKCKLAKEQNFKCVYCGQTIDHYELINNDFAYEIDHIIPESASFDSSLTNLVLVHATENGDKAKMTSYMYINSPKSKMSYENFVTMLYKEIYNTMLSNDQTKRYINKKIDNLKNPINIIDIEENLEFINKNLNDTRYSTSEIRNYIENYKKISNSKFKVKNINGKATAFIRNKIFHLAPKDRNYHDHHAKDAITIAYANKILDEMSKGNSSFEQIIENYSRCKDEIENFDYKFSKMQISNINKQLFNETMYVFKKKIGEENKQFYQIGKENIFNDKLDVLDKIFKTCEKQTIMELSDPKTFNFLKDIYNEYRDSKQFIDGKEIIVKNPFVFAKEVLKIDIVTKKCPKNPELEVPVKTIKYYANKMGKVLDVSHKYNVKGDKIIGYTSINPIKIRIFKSKKTGKYNCMPLNAAIIKRIENDKIQKIDLEKYNKALKEYKINLDEFEFVFDLNPRGSLIFVKHSEWPNGKIFEIVGSPNIGRIELDYIERKKVKELDPIQIVKSISKFTEIKKVNMNVLGNLIKYVEKE